MTISWNYSSWSMPVKLHQLLESLLSSHVFLMPDRTKKTRWDLEFKTCRKRKFRSWRLWIALLLSWYITGRSYLNIQVTFVLIPLTNFSVPPYLLVLLNKLSCASLLIAHLLPIFQGVQHTVSAPLLVWTKIAVLCSCLKSAHRLLPITCPKKYDPSKPSKKAYSISPGCDYGHFKIRWRFVQPMGFLVSMLHRGIY